MTTDATTHVLELVDPRRRAWDGDRPRPVRVHRTVPATPRPGGPLVLLSHGTGGAAVTLRWLAEPLVAAGFAVAAVDHHGNSWADGYHPQAFAAWWDRALDLSFVLDVLERLDAEEGHDGSHDGAGPGARPAPRPASRPASRPAPRPVGAAGFSIGGYTAAALVGARVHPDRFRALVTGVVPAPPTEEYPDVIAAIAAATTPEELAGWPDRAAADLADPRVRSAFLVSPAVGEVLDPASLAVVDRPVAVRWGGADVVTPAEGNGALYARSVPGADGRSAGDDVEHYWFLDAHPQGEPVRARVAQDAVAFFSRTLG